MRSRPNNELGFVRGQDIRSAAQRCKIKGLRGTGTKSPQVKNCAPIFNENKLIEKVNITFKTLNLKFIVGTF